MASSVDEHLDDFTGHTEHLDNFIRGRKRNIDEGPSDDEATRPVKGRRPFSSKASLPSTKLGESTAPSVTENYLTDGESVQAGLNPKSSSNPLVWHHSRNLQESIETDTLECGTDLNRLRWEALIPQRPPGYYLHPYDKRRDAREELELMGVEIIDDEVTDEGDD